MAKYVLKIHKIRTKYHVTCSIFSYFPITGRWQLKYPYYDLPVHQTILISLNFFELIRLQIFIHAIRDIEKQNTRTKKYISSRNIDRWHWTKKRERNKEKNNIEKPNAWEIDFYFIIFFCPNGKQANKLNLPL